MFTAIPREPLPLEADPLRLTQVISNVLGNAAKYTRPCGEIRLSAERSGGDALIRVQDNGIGMDADLLPLIFDLFVQGERSPDRAQGGLGIGLTMARSLVEMHGGSIQAKSDGPGKGSEFVIRIPLAHDQAQTAPADPAGPEPAVPRRILVVDDNIDAAEMMQLLLESDGHAAMTANDGAAAMNPPGTDRRYSFIRCCLPDF